MKKFFVKLFSIIFIIPCLFIFISCTNPTDSITGNNIISSDTDNTNSENEENTTENDEEENNAGENSNNSNENENGNTEIDNDTNVSDKPDEDEDDKVDTNEFLISFNILALAPVGYETIESPIEISKYFNGLTIDSNEGMVYFTEIDYMGATFAFHFKNKDGKNISTTTLDNREHLIFDVYVSSPIYPYFNLKINSNEERINLNTENIINNEYGFEIYKYSYDILITTDTNIALDCINFI